MKITLTDRRAFKITRREITDEGFLRVPGKVARTGIQRYLAYELGIKDGDPNRTVNVYRPADEVFKAESLASYSDKDVTDNHPNEMVSAENFKDLTVGHVTGIGVKDGDFVIADLIIKDKESIKLVNDGKVELSAGYTANYIEESGTTDGGEPYEFVQRDIVINHVALVDNARAGPQARIFDKHNEVNTMPKIVTLDNGRTVEVSNDAEAALIQDSLERVENMAKTATASLDKANKELETAKATIDGLTDEKKKLESKTSDAAIEKRVISLAKLFDSAKKLVKDYDPSGKTEDAIKLEILQKLKPNRDFTDKSADYINAAFDMVCDQEEKEMEDEEEEEKKTSDSLSEFAKDVKGKNKTKTESVVKGRASKDADTSQAWKKTAGVN